MTTDVRRFGAQSMSAPLLDVLVKRPGPAFGAAFDEPAHGFLHPVDLEVARHEHDAFVATLAGLGPRVPALAAAPPTPCGCALLAGNGGPGCPGVSSRA